LNEEAQRELLRSGEQFGQEYGGNGNFKLIKRGGVESPYLVSFDFKGHFTPKEMRRRSTGGGDDGGGSDDGDNPPLPPGLFIFTDPTVLDVYDGERMVELSVVAVTGKVDHISYEVHCINRTDKILKKGVLNNFMSMPDNGGFEYDYAIYQLPPRKRCKQVKVIYDVEHQFSDDNFEPSRSRTFKWDGTVVEN
jgi:hypothetical protein